MRGGHMPEHWSFPRILIQTIRETPQSREREKLLSKEVSVVHAKVHTVLPLFSTLCALPCFMPECCEDNISLSFRNTHPLFGTNILCLDFIIGPLHRRFWFFPDTYYQPPSPSHKHISEA